MDRYKARRRSQAHRNLTILSAGTRARREAHRQQAHDWASVVDWGLLASNLRDRRLLALLGPRIESLANGQADEAFVEAVSEAVRAARRHGTFMLLVTQEVLRALSSAGVRAAPLKGPELAGIIYGDLGARLSGDIDVLVAPEQLGAAVTAVRALGYGHATDPMVDGCHSYT